MRFLGVFQWLYLLGGLASLAAVTVVFYRLGYRKVLVVAPMAITVGLVLAIQAWVFIVLGIPLFGQGIYAALMPALSLVPPVFIVGIALSRRLSA